MNENTIPVRAKVWIDHHLDELIYVQSEAEITPVFAALHFAELSETYASKFDRNLIDDLTALFGTKEE